MKNKHMTVVGYGLAAKKDGKFYLNSKMGFLFDEMSASLDKIYFIASGVGTDDKRFEPGEKGLLSYPIDPNKIEVVVLGNVNPKSLFSKILSVPQKILGFIKYIKKANFVYIFMPSYANYFASILCRLLGKKYFLYFGADWQEFCKFMNKWQGLNKLLYPFYYHLYLFLELDAVKHAAFVIVHGKKLLARFTKKQDKLFETVPMISLKESDMFFRDDSCKGKEINCLFVGSLIPRKGVEFLIEALSLLKKKQYKINLNLVGDIDEEYGYRLKEMTKKLSLHDNVNFLGRLNEKHEIFDYYRKADIFVLPTLGEGFPRVIYESMSQGLPMAISKISTIASVLRDNEDVVFFEPSSAVSCSEAIETLIKNNDLRRKLISSGYDFVKPVLGSGTSAEQRIKLIKEYIL